MRDHTVAKSLHIKLRRVLTLRLWVRISCGWLLALAVACLVLRVAADVPAAVLAWGLLGLVAALVWSWIASGRKVPDEGALLAVLDDRGGLGGVLMAWGEVDVGGWSGQVRAVPDVSVRWAGGRSIAIMSGCILLSVACMLAPYHGRSAWARPRLNVDREVGQLAEHLAVLSETGALDPERASALEKALEDLRRQALGDDPVRTWEAIDHLSAAQMQAAHQALQSAIAEMQQAAAAEALARKLADLKAGQGSAGSGGQGGTSESPGAGEELSAESSLAGVDPGKMAEAMRELAEMAQAAADANAAIELDAELAEALRKLQLTPDQLRQLAEALRQGNEAQVEMMKRLAEARLIDAEALAQCEGACEGGGEGLEALLRELGLGGDAGGLALLDMQGRSPDGSGGVSRGGGPTAMTWRESSAYEGTTFTEERLPVGQIGDLRKSMVLGLSATDATSDEAGASSGGALQGGEGSGSGHRQTILPQHRPAVQRYFDR